MKRGRPALSAEQLPESSRISKEEAKRLYGNPDMDTRTLKKFINRWNVRTTGAETSSTWTIVKSDFLKALESDTRVGIPTRKKSLT